MPDPAVPLPEVATVGDHDVLVWRLPEPVLAVASAPLGGGMGLRSWVVNVQVPLAYDRLDPADHIRDIVGALGLSGEGVGFLTAATVRRWTTADESAPESSSVRVDTTVGIGKPTWAAADEEAEAPVPGTINIVGIVPRRLADAALVNAVATVTEAKVQALMDQAVPGTGTASDAVCILCPADGEPQPFAGPRSALGAPLARAAYGAVAEGVGRFHQEYPEFRDAPG